MKKRVTSLILVAVIMLSLGASAYAAPPEAEENYIEIEIPLDMLLQQSRAMSPLTGTSGIINAFFPPNQTWALSAPWRFDFRDDSLPRNARVTNVTVTYSLSTSTPGPITCYLAIGRPTIPGGDWSPDMLLNPSGGTVSTSWFNNEDPWGEWYVELYAERIIWNFPDYGAAATLSYATLRVYWV